MSKNNNGVITPQKEEKQSIQDVLKEIPDDVLISVIADRFQRAPDEEARKVVQMVSEQSFSGPIPPPSMLREYNAVDKGLANRIVSMAEVQQTHRQKLESDSVEAAVKTESRGQHYALVVSLLIITGALYLIDSGKEISGSILAGGTLTGLAYIFIAGKQKEKTKSSDKQQGS